jgi:hypothetical protein
MALVQMRTRIRIQLQALAMNEGQKWKKRLGSEAERKLQIISTSNRCGLNVFPVSSSVFRRERIRGHPSAQAA